MEKRVSLDQLWVAGRCYLCARKCKGCTTFRYGEKKVLATHVSRLFLSVMSLRRSACLNGKNHRVFVVNTRRSPQSHDRTE